MTNYDVITLRGIGESPNTNMLGNLTAVLPRPRFNVREFGAWDARFIGSVGYTENRLNTAHALADFIRRHFGNPLVLVGYSAGADTIGDALILLDGKDRGKVAWTVLCADPGMPYNPRGVPMLVGSRRPTGFGIRADRPVWMPTPLRWVSAAGDVICDALFGSPARALADHLVTAGPVGRQRPAFYDALGKARTFQYVDPSPLSLWGAAVDINAYLIGGAHTRPYPPLLRAVGEEIVRALP